MACAKRPASGMPSRNRRLSDAALLPLTLTRGSLLGITRAAQSFCWCMSTTSFAKSPEDVIWAANTIQSAFDARDLGAAHVYLGRTIAHDRHLRILMLSLSG